MSAPIFPGTGHVTPSGNPTPSSAMTTRYRSSLRPEGAEKLFSAFQHGQIQCDVQIVFVLEPGQNRPALTCAILRVLAEQSFECFVRVADALIAAKGETMMAMGM
jgi:hypothetical protein